MSESDPQSSPPSLTPSEWEVMKVLWDRGASAARDVFAAIPPDRTWTYRTIKTLLSRLVAKGAINYDQIGNSYLYRPAVSRDRLSREEVQSVFQRIMSEACSPVLAHFIEEADLSVDEIEQLQQRLAEKRKDKERGKRKRGPRS